VPPEPLTPSGHPVGTACDARGADWAGIHLGDSDLSEARLCRVDLRGADLSGYQLDGTDLRLARYKSATRWPENFDFRSSGAVAPHARLSGSFLDSADLAGMDLNEAILIGAYLSVADLSGACLRGARLAGADLRHALLHSGLCEGVRFSGC
jgi:uncharacterized protein YjbI with pentapeptide repeats